MTFKSRRRSGEASFTLIETIIALGLISTFLIQVILVQGRSVEFSDYNRRITQAGWLAQAVMAQIERASTLYNFSDLKLKLREENFSEEFCNRDPVVGCDYTYSASIEEFKLPIIDMIVGAVAGGGDENSEAGSLGDVIKAQVKDYLGDEQFRMAKVEVHWPEGSRQESYELVYLITNQMKLDESILSLKPSGKPSGKPSETKGRNDKNSSKEQGNKDPND